MLYFCIFVFKNEKVNIFKLDYLFLRNGNFENSEEM